MKIESKSDAEEIKLNMTAMIDIVFQLLVFFIMTFKIVALEGDFSVKMPQTSDTPIDRLLDELPNTCLLYTSPSPRDLSTSRMPSSA